VVIHPRHQRFFFRFAVYLAGASATWGEICVSAHARNCASCRRTAALSNPCCSSPGRTSCEIEQLDELMRQRVLDPGVTEDGFQQFLRSLLGVKPENLHRRVGIVQQFVEYVLLLRGLGQQQGHRLFTRRREDKRGSINSKSTSLSGRASPRAREPNMTIVAFGAAARSNATAC